MNVRRLALDVLSDVTDGGAYANLRLKQAQAGLSAADARFLSALVYTTLDRLLYLDYILSAFAPGRQKRTVRALLRLGACELLCLRTPPHAAVSEYVSLCKQLGKGAAAGFVNAVLRRVDRERDALPPLPDAPDARLSIEYSYPLWLVRLWCAERGEAEARQLLAAAPRPLSVRAQYPETTEGVLAALPCGATRGHMDENCLYLDAGMDVTADPLFQAGRLAVQGEGAMLACRALGDCRGRRVLDACAAPGGKSAYIASLSENQAALTCFELHAHRLSLLQSTLERLHVRADLRQRDASVHDPAFDGAFDAVLVDAPCSGLGLLNGKPDLRYRKQPADIGALAQIQAHILDACAPYVRPGGTLVYATCTVSAAENERQTAAFFSRHPEFSPAPLPFHDGHELQLLPHRHGTEGFYLARMQRCT